MVKYGNLVSGSQPKPEPTQPKQVAGTDTGTRGQRHVQASVHSDVHTPVLPKNDHYTHVVHKAVKWPGKENGHLKISGDEVQKLKRAISYFDERSIYTDRTQIIRVSMNFMLLDFEQRGDESYLAEILNYIQEI